MRTVTDLKAFLVDCSGNVPVELLIDGVVRDAPTLTMVTTGDGVKRVRIVSGVAPVVEDQPAADDVAPARKRKGS